MSRRIKKGIIPWMMSLLILLGILALAVPSNLSASPVSGAISIERRGDTVSIDAVDAPLREVLKALGEKTGVRFIVHEMVPDRLVSLKQESISSDSLHAILERMNLRNTMTSSDPKTGQTIIHVLPEGKVYSDLVKNPTVISAGPNRATGSGRQALLVKGKEVVTEPLSNNRLAVRYIRDEVMLNFRQNTLMSEIRDVLKK